MEIILTRVFKIETPTLRMSFGFIAVAIMGMLYGPLYAGFAAAIADFTGATMVFGSAYPGLTVTAFLIGVVYGLFLHKHPIKFWRICVAVTIVIIGLNLILDTFWLSILHNRGILALLPERIFRTIVMLPIQIICIRFIASRRFDFIYKKYQ
jgi:ECF transporter S component (folate family)